MLELRIKEYIILVDDEDTQLISQYKWAVHSLKKRNTGYVTSTFIDKNNKIKQIKMHRLILGVIDPKIEVDHIDGNGLNNQKSNLRLATRQQNSTNSKKRKTTRGFKCTSKYKGVHWEKRTKNWKVEVTFNKKKYFIGRYKKEEEAAQAYNNAATNFFGEFAKLNIIP